jgi:hypothetical protein
MRNLETSGNTVQGMGSRALPTTLHNVSNSKRIYIMLSTGRIVLPTSNFTPSLLKYAMKPTTPNNRLIRQLSKFLNEFNQPHTLETISGRKMVSIKKRVGLGFDNLLIYSSPTKTGQSYIKAQVININNSINGDNFTFEFIAHSAIQIINKLQYHKVYSMCPNSLSCHVNCANCAEI